MLALYLTRYSTLSPCFTSPLFSVVQVIVPTVLTVYIGLSAVFMSAADYTGDRANLLSVSILICMLNLERDHGLGKMTYLCWFDTFNVFQTIVLLIALLEGFLEHSLVRMNKASEAFTLNRVWRYAMLLVIYPLSTMAVILFGAQKDGLAYMCVVLAVISIILSGIIYHRKRSHGSHRARTPQRH
jgi:hypothetical protein